MLSSHDECKFTFIHVYISIPFFLTHLSNFGHSHLDAVYTLPGLLSQCKKNRLVRCTLLVLYGTICMCCYLCVCVSCSEATAFPYFWDNNMLAHTQTLHHGLRNSFFSITWMPWRLIPPGTQNIPPDHPTHYGSPPLCRSCHGPRFCRRHALAQKSVCLLVSVFPDWFWDNMIPPGTRNGSTIPPFCRSYHGPGICRRHASARKSFVCLLVSVFPDWFRDNRTSQNEYMVSIGHAYLAFFNCEAVCLTNTSLIMYINDFYIYKFYFCQASSWRYVTRIARFFMVT
jgi:hypothetical protein